MIDKEKNAVCNAIFPELSIDGVGMVKEKGKASVGTEGGFFPDLLNLIFNRESGRL